MNESHLFDIHKGLSGTLSNFELREGQQTLANAIFKAINESSHLVAEAGTGIGKTFSYLLPAMTKEKRTFVSTATKHLQDQIFFKDIPIIEQVLGRKINACLLKGRANYLCHHRFLQFESSNQGISPYQLKLFKKIKDWQDKTTSGDLSEIFDFSEQDISFIKKVTSTIDNCLGQECGYFSKCFVQKVRDKAKRSELVVVNHALLLADIIIKETGFAEILPDVEVVIIDEAHQLAKFATNAFAKQITSTQLIDLVRDIQGVYLDKTNNESKFLLEFIDIVHKFIDCMPEQEGDKKMALRDIRLYPKLYEQFKLLMQGFKSIIDKLGELKERSEELDRLYERTENIADCIKHIFTTNHNDGEKEHSVSLLVWGSNFFHAIKMPIHLGNRFQYIMSDYADSWVFVSATLCIEDSFLYYKKELGLSADIPELLINSPFDYKKNCKLHVLENMPDPRSPQFISKLVQKAVPIIRLVGGRAFILFTSYKALYEAVKLLEKEDFKLFVQGDAPKATLVQQFIKQDSAILLGTISFWEGVDVQGDRLSCVIIDKIPFPSPKDPLVEEQIHYLESKGLNSFVHFFIPQAVTMLKQGSGRLIRSKSDKGILIFADPRLKTKGYGAKLLNSLPDAEQVDYNGLIEFIEEKL